MRIVFMGTPDFAVSSLEELNKDQSIDVVGVITQPDRPRGRGQKMQPTPVKKRALALGLPIFQVKNVNNPDFIEQLKELEPEALVVVAFGQKLGEELLYLTRYGSINLHASLLPEYRGASPIHQAIIEGKNMTGVTTMYMDEGWDTGDIIYKQEVEIKRSDTVGDLHDRLAEVGAELLVKTIQDIEKGTEPRKSQDDDLASYTAKIDRETGQINWTESAEDIFNLVRGVNPWPGAYTKHQDNTLKIWWVDPHGETGYKDRLPGEVVEAGDEQGLLIKAGRGIISIEEIQLAGKKKMSIKDFIRGYNIDEGDSLGDIK